MSTKPQIQRFQSLKRKGGFGRVEILFHVGNNKKEPPCLLCVNDKMIKDKIRQAPSLAFNIKITSISTVCLKHLFKCQYPLCFSSDAGLCHFCLLSTEQSWLLMRMQKVLVLILHWVLTLLFQTWNYLCCSVLHILKNISIYIMLFVNNSYSCPKRDFPPLSEFNLP